MFDHIGVPARDLDASKRFYATVLAPLGFVLTYEGPDLIEFGALSIGMKEPPIEPIHFAFLARSREAVDAFHQAGIEAGYQSNGEPGLREYADDYYASFLLDPDSHNVEAVFRDPAKRATWDWLRWEP